MPAASAKGLNEWFASVKARDTQHRALTLWQIGNASMNICFKHTIMKAYPKGKRIARIFFMAPLIWSNEICIGERVEDVKPLPGFSKA